MPEFVVQNATLALQSVLQQPAKLEPAASSNGVVAFYRYRDSRRDLFIKAQVEEPQATDWPEAVVNAWAAAHGWSPAVYPTPSHLKTIISDFVSVPHLTFADTQRAEIRAAFVDVIREVHRAPSPQTRGLYGDAIFLNDWPGFVKRGMPCNNNPCCDLTSLQHRVVWLESELRRSPAPQVFSHFDPLRKNMFWSDEKLFLIDWGISRFSDPLRDLGKFFGFYQLKADDAVSVLSRYFLGPPRAQDLRRFALWLQAMSIDQYAFKVEYATDQGKAARFKAEHIADLGTLLPDGPKVRWLFTAHKKTARAA